MRALGQPKGIGWEGGGRRVQEWWGGGIHVYLWAIHVDVWQKPPQYCKVIILQLNLKIKYLEVYQKKEMSCCSINKKDFISSFTPAPSSLPRAPDSARQPWCLDIETSLQITWEARNAPRSLQITWEAGNAPRSPSAWAVTQALLLPGDVRAPAGVKW